MRLRFASLLVAATVAVALSAACSNQSEGEPCDGLNGNNDCNDGLVCRPPTNSSTNVKDICCPADGTSTTAACAQGQTLDGGSSAPPDAQADAPADSGSSGDGALDATGGDGASDAPPGDGATEGSATDGATDGGVDGANDAPTDGPPLG